MDGWIDGQSSSGFRNLRNCPATLGARWFPFTDFNIFIDKLGNALGELIPVKSRFKEGKPQPPHFSLTLGGAFGGHGFCGKVAWKRKAQIRKDWERRTEQGQLCVLI